MTDQDKLELVSAAIDGELDDGERTEIEALLDSSEEARELQADLEQLDSVLKGVPALDPPESLHARIMAEAEPPSIESKASVLDWLRQLVPGAGLRYAIAASAGALVAAVIIGGQGPVSVPADPNDLVGLMAPESQSGSTEILDSYAYIDGRMESRIQLRISGDKLFLDIAVNTDEALDINVDLGATGLWPDAMAQVEGRSRSIAFAGQTVELQAQGQQHTTILLRRIDDAALAGEAKITLDISSGGRSLGQGTLNATW